MNIKAVQELVQILESSNLESITYKDKTLEIEVKKPGTNVSMVASNAHTLVETQTNQKQQVETSGHVVKAPLVGVYYAKQSPDKEPFVSVGDVVEKGDVLCIIEAMKVMNEIKAPIAGTVKTLYKQDGETVDFDQGLVELV